MKNNDRVQVLLTDHRFNLTVVVAAIRCDEHGVIMVAHGYHPTGAEIGGYLSERLNEFPFNPRYELQFKLLAPGQDATIYYNTLGVLGDAERNSN